MRTNGQLWKLIGFNFYSKFELILIFRKLAQQWHPDNFQDDAEKKRAQEKFILIAAAKDVLTDPEKRRMFVFK